MANRKGNTRKRANSEGSVYQRADGRWCAVISLGRGKRKSVYGRTREEAHNRLIAVQKQRLDGLPILSEKRRLGEYLEAWLENTARLSLRPYTHLRYAQLLRNDVIPTLGSRRIVRLSTEDLQRLYAQKLAQGLSPRSVGHIHRVLHKALADALRAGVVARNVVDTVRAPKVSHKEMLHLEPAEARAFMGAAMGDPFEALFTVALTAGLRQGELLALKWQDVDLDTGRLQVRRSVRQIPRVGFVEQEPKSARSRRQITLTSLAVDSLRRHRARQLEYRLAAIAYEDNGLVFANEIGRHIDHRNLVRRHFLPLLERAGVKRIRFHDLRHSCATLLLSDGVHPKIVQEMLGHSQIAVTLDLYSHVTPTMQAEAAQRMQALLAAR